MAKPRLLTKSRFKIGAECPTKLYFQGKREYGNNNADNAFLAALAEGGFQVGELAKVYFSGGIEVTEPDPLKAVAATTKLLSQENVILYEPAFQFGDFLVRVDIFIKRGTHVELIEVKAKSFDPADSGAFYNRTLMKKGITKLSSDWEPYLMDVAFQGYVLKGGNPDWKISHFLLMADKTAKAEVDGLNQFFLLEKSSDGRVKAKTKPGLDRSKLGRPLLTKVAVDAEVGVAHGDTYLDGKSFAEYAQFLADAWKNDKMVPAAVGSHCKTCEFRISDSEISKGLKSGFNECWSIAQALKAEELKKPLVFDVWNFRKGQALIDSGRIFMDEIKMTDINPASKGEDGLSSSERQWLQVEKEIDSDSSPFCDVDGLQAEFSKFNFPLNFIDFETTMVAIPFHKGRRPYEQIAFQFSHHVVQRDGSIEHKNQYIETTSGRFPNFDFVRALRKALGDDGGSIFRYATHENTVLCQIRQQLILSAEGDRFELIEWIETVTYGKDEDGNAWTGHRSMIDLCDFVKKYYYHPSTKGSNSIKKVLPAILSTSRDIQRDFAKPIYGAPSGIKSLNFKSWAWIQLDRSGKVLDPYKLLPPVFKDIQVEEMDALITGDSLADGGAAMTAFARMQFTEMSDVEREAVTNALLKYCELDTFAMVLIYQHWKYLIEVGHEKTETA